MKPKTQDNLTKDEFLEFLEDREIIRNRNLNLHQKHNLLDRLELSRRMYRKQGAKAEQERILKIINSWANRFVLKLNDECNSCQYNKKLIKGKDSFYNTIKKLQEMKK